MDDETALRLIEDMCRHTESQAMRQLCAQILDLGRRHAVLAAAAMEAAAMQEAASIGFATDASVAKQPKSDRRAYYRAYNARRSVWRSGAGWVPALLRPRNFNAPGGSTTAARACFKGSLPAFPFQRIGEAAVRQCGGYRFSRSNGSNSRGASASSIFRRCSMMRLRIIVVAW